MKKISIFNGILIILAVAILLFGGVFGYQWYVNSKLQTTNYKQTQVFSTETTDWKTYSNTEYGFAIKYPNDFIITESDELDATKDQAYHVVDLYSYSSDSFNVSMTIVSEKNVSDGECTFYDVNEDKINIDGVEAYFYDGEALDRTGGITLSTSYVFEKNSICYDIYFSRYFGDLKKYNKDNDYREKDLFKTIVSTFKFTK